MIIETERLFLREMTEDDFHSLYKMLADSNIMQHYPYIFDEERVRNRIPYKSRYAKKRMCKRGNHCGQRLDIYEYTV